MTREAVERVVTEAVLLPALDSAVVVATVAVLTWLIGKPEVAPPNGKRGRTCWLTWKAWLRVKVPRAQLISPVASVLEQTAPDLVLAGAPTYISEDREHALSRVRGFPATVSNHVRDLLRHYAPSDLPADLVEGMDRVGGYDYQQHGQPDAPHVRAVTDAMAERLTLIGTAAQVRDKIRQLEAAGVTQVCLYLSIVEPDRHFSTLETYGREIIPAFR